jgi:hypothetical protein
VRVSRAVAAARTAFVLDVTIEISSEVQVNLCNMGVQMHCHLQEDKPNHFASSRAPAH